MLRKYEFPLIFLPILLGLIGFFIVVGPKALNPINIEWLLRGESLEDYLAWVFYRESPWGFPIGINPNYGLEISSSIVYSDSIPLFAIIFKLLSPIIPENFQYFGIWLLTCFIFQAIAAWQLINLITQRKLVLIAGTVLFIFSPLMLWRIEILQCALAGHFLILFGIYLNLKPSQARRELFWCSILCASILVHFYIFAMVFGLWIASLMDALVAKGMKSIRKCLFDFLITLLFLGITAWQAGYLLISGSSASEWGYGQFNFNLLSPFYSRGWSNIVLIKDYVKDFESFNYVGLGAICLVLFAFVISIKRIKKISITSIRKHFFSC